MKENFIRTSDKETALLLEEEGFVKIDESNGFYTFLNQTHKNFSRDVDEKKISYTNILNI